MMESIVEIDAAQCVACGICVDVCPEAALVMGEGDDLPAWLPAPCTYCNLCARECPTGAVSVLRDEKKPLT